MSDTEQPEKAEKTKKRSPKRLDVESLQARVKKRQSGGAYRGANFERIKWDTLRYDEEKLRQVIDIETVDRDGNPDGKIRTIATSDLQHTRHNKELAKQIQRERNNIRRRQKRKEDKAEEAKSEETDKAS